MKTLLLALTLFAAVPALAQDDEDHTPPAKILSMSVDQWNAYFAKKHGGEETEASDRQSIALYADALRSRNDAALRRLPPPARARITQARKIVQSFSDNALTLAEIENGGGTMFIEIDAGASLDVEQFIWTQILHDRHLRSHSPSPVRLAGARLAEIHRQIVPYDPSSANGKQSLSDVYDAETLKTKRKDALDAYAGLKQNLQALRGWLVHAPAPEALAVTGFLRKKLPDWLHPIGEH